MYPEVCTQWLGDFFCGCKPPINNFLPNVQFVWYSLGACLEQTKKPTGGETGLPHAPRTVPYYPDAHTASRHPCRMVASQSTYDTFNYTRTCTSHVDILTSFVPLYYSMSFVRFSVYSVIQSRNYYEVVSFTQTQEGLRAHMP